jgi:hypothetical protein
MAVKDHIDVASLKAVVDLKIGNAQLSVNEHPGGLKIHFLFMRRNRLGNNPSIRFATSRKPPIIYLELIKTVVYIFRKIRQIISSFSWFI